MTKTTLLALALLPATIGCDVALFPTRAHYVGTQSARASVSVAADTTIDRDGIDAVEVEVVDVALHRPDDDTWVLLGAQSIRVDLLRAPRAPSITRVPLRPVEYDRVAFGLAAVDIVVGDTAYSAAVDEAEIVIEGEFDVGGEVVLQLTFDLDASVIGDPASGFTLEPVVSASVNS